MASHVDTKLVLFFEVCVISEFFLNSIQTKKQNKTKQQQNKTNNNKIEIENESSAQKK
jgi:hypothetical protein